MQRLTLFLLLFTLLLSPSASADWRWTKPRLSQQTVTYHCDTLKCIRKTYIREKQRYLRRVARYDKQRQREWHYWVHQYIPTCTWYGESGTGPEFSPVRYVTPNAQGSGAYGKYQMMSGTYHNRAKYHDWSPLDQEIAGHKEYWAHGTAPWTNCA